jgi:hypothetical protein
MHYEDQKHLLAVMQEQFFTLNKHGGLTAGFIRQLQ